MDLLRDTGSDPPGRPLRRLGKYELITRLAAGGMAEVYLARLCGPMNFQKAMVVKTIHPHLATEGEFLRMLFDEARLSALIKHPQVVDIYELGCEDGVYFLAMEHIDGEPLSSILRAGASGQALGALGTARVIADAAGGLHAAHELRSPAGELLGLVHRDVSPGNIMVRYDGGVKIVDFGIAKARGRLAVSHVWQFKGKAGYVAPEQIRGGAVDRRTDVYGLGVVLWEALTLRRYKGGAGVSPVVGGAREPQATPPSAICPDVPTEISDICIKAMQPDPDHRFQTADEMKRALEEVLLDRGFFRESGHVQQYMQRVFAGGGDAELGAFSAADGSSAASLAATGEDEAPASKADAESEGAELAELARGTAVDTGEPELEDRAPAPSPRTAKPELEYQAPAPSMRTATRPRPRRRVRPIFSLLALATVIVCGGAVWVERDSWIAAIENWLDHGHSRVQRAALEGARSSMAAAPAAAAERARRAQRYQPDRAAGAEHGVEPGAEETAEVAPEPAAAALDAGVAPAVEAAGAMGASAPAQMDASAVGADAGVGAPSSDAARVYEEGIALLVRGREAMAKERFKKAIALDRDFAPAHRGLALAYAGLGRPAKARRSLSRYLELRPDADDAAAIRARIEGGRP